MQPLFYILIALGLPVFGFVLTAIVGKRLPEFLQKWVPVGLMSLSVVSVYWAAAKFVSTPAATWVYKFPWLKFTDSLVIDMGVEVNALSILMLVVISTVSLLVHLYSTQYMKGEKRISSYFSYLQLFTASMMALVISGNLFQMYFFWELVGVSSFLLIGFYCTQPAAIAAAKKAFIVTRFADFGMLLGILILGLQAKSFDVATLINTLTAPGYIAAQFMGMSIVAWGALLVFIGGAGKSAIFPLHIWLPDAMEGPTPVSALIHAATMVVAGVFLVARLFPLYAIAAPGVLHVIAVLACITALFAALVACTQTDLKKVLAYSTISQIAFMMLGLGVAGLGGDASEGYTAALFHLFTHAFFKAGLFLCAGVVIHAVGSGVLENLGGLRKSLPITHIVFLVAALAISGVPFLSGFYSKEAILAAAFRSSPVLYAAALLASGLTAFYMFRIFFLVFYNKPARKVTGHTVEPWQMTVPLLILGGLSIVAGYIDFGRYIHADASAIHLSVHWGFSIAPVLVAFAGIVFAANMYLMANDLPQKTRHFFGSLYAWFYHKLYIDEIYLFVAKKIMIEGLGGLIVWVDAHIVQAAVSASGDGFVRFSESIKKIQSGRIQSYGYYFLGGVILIAVMLLAQYWI